MARQEGMFRFTLKLASLIGFSVMALPLYLYPMAAIDPVEAYPFYTAREYFSLFVPFAFVFFISSFLIACGKKNFIFLLLFGFIASHFHFVQYFGNKIVLKPAFATVFIVIPTVVFLVAAFGVLMTRTGGPRKAGP